MHAGLAKSVKMPHTTVAARTQEQASLLSFQVIFSMKKRASDEDDNTAL
jgi:hypothetical protein